MLMGITRCGVLLKFIPFPVTVGFTTGIAVVIASSQVKDFFGLAIENVPPAFLEKCQLFCQLAHTWNLGALLISLGTLIFIFVLRHYFPRWPGAITAIILATLATVVFELPIETIQSKFGEIPSVLPSPSLPHFSWDFVKKVFPDALTIALLGAIESLLSASVADGMIGTKHRSNMELVAQGFANLGSIIFGGIPATGAIARTSANIKLGAKTPIAGVMHAVTLLLLMICLAPLAGMIPLAALAGILLFVAWNMSEIPHFVEILRGQKGDALLLLTTFLLTVLIDLAVAVQVGVFLAAVVFLKRMSDATTVRVCRLLLKENQGEGISSADDDILLKKDIPEEVAVFEITGPFFYCVADLLDEALLQLDTVPQVFILRLNKTPLIDATGLQAIKKFGSKCTKKGIAFLVSDVTREYRALFQKAHFEQTIDSDHLFDSFELALAHGKKLVK